MGAGVGPMNANDPPKRAAVVKPAPHKPAYDALAAA